MVQTAGNGSSRSQNYNGDRILDPDAGALLGGGEVDTAEVAAIMSQALGQTHLLFTVPEHKTVLPVGTRGSQFDVRST